LWKEIHTAESNSALPAHVYTAYFWTIALAAARTDERQTQIVEGDHLRKQVSLSAHFPPAIPSNCQGAAATPGLGTVVKVGRKDVTPAQEAQTKA